MDQKTVQSDIKTQHPPDAEHAHSADLDGKSTTASAADAAHYPDPSTHDHDGPAKHGHFEEPTYTDINALAHRLWVKRGCPRGSPETDWLEAERQLKDKSRSDAQLQTVMERGGSVQP